MISYIGLALTLCRVTTAGQWGLRTNTLSHNKDLSILLITRQGLLSTFAFIRNQSCFFVCFLNDWLCLLLSDATTGPVRNILKRYPPPPQEINPCTIWWRTPGLSLSASLSLVQTGGYSSCCSISPLFLNPLPEHTHTHTHTHSVPLAPPPSLNCCPSFSPSPSLSTHLSLHLSPHLLSPWKYLLLISAQMVEKVRGVVITLRDTETCTTRPTHTHTHTHIIKNKQPAK